MADTSDSTPASVGQEDGPVLFIRDGVPFTNSREVAARFGKDHDSVLRKIRNLIAQAGNIPLRSFAEGTYTLPETLSQQHKLFMMDRDGFALLAMGFTGAKALRWKLRWIEAFNRMEAELRATATPEPASPFLPGAVPFLAGSEPLVSSRAVGQALGRRHTHILREIDVLAAEQPGLVGQHVRFSTYLHENRRPYRCFHLDRLGFEALMRRLPSTDGRVVALRDATLAAWPVAAAPGAGAAEAPGPLPPGGPSLERDGVAAMRLDGKTVLVDLLHLATGAGTQAVVIGWDATIAIQDMAEARSHSRFLGDRSFTVPDPAGGAKRRSFWAVGTVVATQAAARPEPTMATKPRAARSSRRRDALPVAPLAATAVAGHA